MILNKAQAEAVYSAMCALNNVNALANIILDKVSYITFKRVFEVSTGVKVIVCVEGSVTENESYKDQSAFATAYGVNK